MKSCDDIHDRIALGESPDSPEELAHLEACESCRLLLADDSHLGRTLAEVPREPLDLSGLREAVGEELAAEKGPVAYLRSRATPVRFAVAMGLTAVIAMSMAIFAPRPDIAVYPRVRLYILTFLLVAPLLAGLLIVLRPLQRRAVSSAVAWGTLALAVGVPWLFALLPQAHVLHPASLHGAGPELISYAVPCFVFGLLTGLPLLIAFRVLDRGAHASMKRALLAAGGAGLLGNLALLAHCPITAPAHLALGHATVGVMLVAVYLAVGLRRRSL